MDKYKLLNVKNLISSIFFILFLISIYLSVNIFIDNTVATATSKRLLPIYRYDANLIDIKKFTRLFLVFA